ncbi:MAG TPA: PAS domain S-box protein [Verrucomicrobiae bacterium]|nr:PAS domain S-box protein [Verrucomicrobiae bacterium]
MIKISRRILVVDDNPAIHQDFRKILGSKDSNADELQSTEAALFGEVTLPGKSADFELDFAFQGEEALAMVRRAMLENRPYAMAFMDVRMPPGWDGIETTAKLWEVDRHLQVAFCTAYSDYSWEAMSGKLGNLDSFVILKKPFEVVEVLQLANAFTAKWSLAHETHQHLTRLQESERRYQLLTNTFPSPIWTAGPGGEIDYVNQQTLICFGVTADELLGTGWEKFLHPEDHAEVASAWAQSVASGQTYQTECRLRRADGTYRWHVCRAHACRSDSGELLQWVGTLTDIEDRKTAEQALQAYQIDPAKPAQG